MNGSSLHWCEFGRFTFHARFSLRILALKRPSFTCTLVREEDNNKSFLFAGQHGWLSPRLAATIRWNRTANVNGGAGNNVALDLVNEHLNREFKRMLFSF